MKNRKSKKRTVEQSPYAKPLGTSISSCFNIKFDFTKTNLSCFIDPKRQNKKTLAKRSQSIKMRKPSQKKKAMQPNKEEQRVQKSKSKKRLEQSPDIVRESLNSILNKIETEGIKCEWKQQEHSPKQSNRSEGSNQTDEIWSVFSVNQSIQKSYASTMDYQAPVQYHSMNYETQKMQPAPFSYIFDPNIFQIRISVIGYDPRTTIMIRNIPNKYTVKDLAQEIDFYFDNTYDFLYLPCDFKNQCNVGYGFINFVDTCFLKDFYLEFHNHKWGKFRSEKICILTYARLQGLDSLIEHFANSKVLNSKEKKYRPIIKQQNTKINNLIRSQQGH